MNVGEIKARLDRVQRGRRWLAFPYAVVKKFGEDSSSNLAVVITYYTFFSVFPLLLALFSVLGFVLRGHPSWQRKIETSTLHQLPLVKGPVPDHGSLIVVLLGVLLALYSGLGVARSAQTAWDVVYRVPSHKRPGYLTRTARALRLVVVGGLGLIATTVVAGSVASGGAIGLHLGPGWSILGIVVSLTLNALLFAVIFRWLTVRPVSFRQALPGAVVAAVALEVLQALASAFIAHKLKHVKPTYGAFGAVIVLLSWFALQSQVLLLAAQVNVVKQDRLWPRSLAEPPAESPPEDAAD